MNEGHLKFLASPGWAQWLETQLMPWVLQTGELGDDVLEIGPGYGATTRVLLDRVPRLTAVEVDEASAARLRVLTDDHGALMVFGHDPQQWHDLRRAPDGFYD